MNAANLLNTFDGSAVNTGNRRASSALFEVALWTGKVVRTRKDRGRNETTTNGGVNAFESLSTLDSAGLLAASRAEGASREVATSTGTAGRNSGDLAGEAEEWKRIVRIEIGEKVWKR